MKSVIIILLYFSTYGFLYSQIKDISITEEWKKDKSRRNQIRSNLQHFFIDNKEKFINRSNDYLFELLGKPDEIIDTNDIFADGDLGYINDYGDFDILYVYVTKKSKRNKFPVSKLIVQYNRTTDKIIDLYVKGL